MHEAGTSKDQVQRYHRDCARVYELPCSGVNRGPGPGHGWVEADSHVDPPVDDRRLDEIAPDIEPHRRLKRDAVMPAQLICRVVDPRPAGFPRFWIRLLRDEIGLDGAISGDDLSLAGAGAAGGTGQQCTSAGEAGCDPRLVCNSPDAVGELPDGWSVTPDPRRRQRSAKPRPFRSGGRRSGAPGAGRWRYNRRVGSAIARRAPVSRETTAMNDVRARAKAFFNALDFNRPIDFGVPGLVNNGLGQELYVERIHGGGESDPVQQLADQIDFSESAGAYLFTGNRGTGKTTELLRLARILDGYGCEVFYADLSEYLILTQRVEISDFLVSVLGALSEKIGQRFGAEPGREGFFDRVWKFLLSDVVFEEVKLPAGPLELKASLHQNPTFKEELQKRTRGLVEQLVRQARTFVGEAVDQVRSQRQDPARKLVLIVDSVERLRGVGDSADVREVFKSAETLFSSHAEKLRFSGLSVVYTVPPYLLALAGGLGAYYAGGRIYALPSVHIYRCRPAAGKPAEIYAGGQEKMRAIIDRRYPAWSDFFTEKQLNRLAESSGGDLRDYFRMLRLAVTRLPANGVLPLADTVLLDAEQAVRGDMLPIAADDRGWLARITTSHQPELPSLDKLADFARLQQGKYVLQYRNGEDWYDVHPLLRREVAQG
ncbi:MAG: Beta-hexosaminidase [Candidatus Accumulibacter adjunctus]|uniref:beta-N-acetylhexosaminidase n=1 Tax=Candidatus Accumulibacter adjunctus TaxID=1454001 RepID=A0A011NVB1_9PROT|nr:MAG: Beta-hexosaminidase [Candidatus Accumulibacter adjunctus]